MLTVGIDNLPITGRDAFDTRIDDMTMKKIGLRQEIPARAKRKAQRELAGWTGQSSVDTQLPLCA